MSKDPALRPGYGRRPGEFGVRGARFAPVVKPRHAREALARLMGYIGQQRALLAVVVGATLASSAVAVVAPRIVGQAIDPMITSGQLPGLARSIATLAALYAAGAFAMWVQQTAMTEMSNRTLRQMRHDLFAKVQRLPLTYFDGAAQGDLMSRLANDVDTVGLALGQPVAQLLSSTLSIFGILAMMVSMDVTMTLVVLAMMPVTLFVAVKVAGWTRRHFKRRQEALGELNAYVEELISGIRVVKAFNREREVRESFSGRNAELRLVAYRAELMTGVFMPLMHLIDNIGFAVVALAGGLLSAQARITVGTAAAFQLYSRQFMQPVREISNQWFTVQSGLAGAERVLEIMDYPVETDAPGARPLAEQARLRPTLPESGSEDGSPAAPRAGKGSGSATQTAAPSSHASGLAGHVVFDGVSFSYVHGVPVLEDISFEALPGQTVAIVGETGSGKTTLISLLARFYPVQSGRILVDGVDISRATLQSVRRNLGIVLQDSHLFSGTVRENIRFGRLDATDEEVERAARLAYADPFIRRMPNGYDSMLTADGRNLSQGQRQLLSIARAILAAPAILVLDEATSNVDTQTEMAIQKAMLELMKGRTSLVIAHRLSTVQGADLILVLDRGRIVERGTHRELLESGGHYAELYNSQLSPVNSEAS